MIIPNIIIPFRDSISSMEKPCSLTSSNPFSLDILRTSSRLYSLTHGFEQKNRYLNLNDLMKGYKLGRENA